jgi:hypothetical protein
MWKPRKSGKTRTIKYLGKQDGRKEEIRIEGERTKLRVEKKRRGDQERVVKRGR